MPTTATRAAEPRRLTTEIPISPASQADPDLDTLIWEITADCNDEEEVLMGFEGAFDEDGNFPCPGKVVGEPVEVLSISAGDDRRGLTATCTRTGHRYEIALLDIEIDADPATSRLLAACRRWASA